MAISPIFSIVEVKFFIVRLVVFFVFMGLLLMIFVGFVEITKTSEDERLLNNAAEALMTSSLTEGKGVFSTALKIEGFTLDDLAGNNIELPRYCNSGLQFELKRLRDGRTWKWGYTNSQAPTVRKYIAWVKTGSASDQAILTVSLIQDQITKLSCAIERAFLFKEIQELDIECPENECMYERQDSNICLLAGLGGGGVAQTACRWLPNIPVEQSTFGPAQGKQYVVPIKKGGDSSCPARGQLPAGAFRTEDDRKNFDVEKIVFCLR